VLARVTQIPIYSRGVALGHSAQVWLPKNPADNGMTTLNSRIPGCESITESTWG